MNIQLKLEDANWRTYLSMLKSAVADGETFLKKAFLIVWPREAAKHFDEEMGPEGRWAAWKASTRKQRIAHEIAHTSAKQRAFARTSFVRPGGKLLQITGTRLRNPTVNEPQFVELPNGLKVQSPATFSGYLNDGVPPGDGSRMAARPFMWMGDEAQETLAEILIRGIWDKAGGD